MNSEMRYSVYNEKANFYINWYIDDELNDMVFSFHVVSNIRDIKIIIMLPLLSIYWFTNNLNTFVHLSRAITIHSPRTKYRTLQTKLTTKR